MPFNSVQKDLNAVSMGKNEDDNVSNSYERNSNVLKQPVSPENSGDNERNSYASKAPKIGHCAYCNNEFVKSNSWHKYCAELCRIKAYELRTGKKFYRKTG